MNALRRNVMKQFDPEMTTCHLSDRDQLAGPRDDRVEKESPLRNAVRRIAYIFDSGISLLRYQGPSWVAYRCVYALRQRNGWFQRALPCSKWEAHPTTDIYSRAAEITQAMGRRPVGTENAVQQAVAILGGQGCWFSRHQHPVGFPPDWFADPWNTCPPPPDLRHWSLIGDFTAGDIKRIWEQSRFSFVFVLVRAHAKSGDARFVEAFWRSIEDWREKNQPQRGVHWKCGQEIGLRAMAWVFGLLHFLNHESTTPERRCQLTEMLEVSGHRIATNIDYALSQRNNHGVTEAAALFTLGLLLNRSDWVARGEKLLSSLADELIYDDGTFSQHSTNYHRLMLHDYLWACWFGRLANRPLAERVTERVRLAGLWIKDLLCPITGRVPNLGANDGARFLDLTDLDYLDYRPVVQAVGLLTEGHPWLPSGKWDELSEWLSSKPAGCDQHMRTAEDGVDGVRIYPIGGYAVWRHRGAMAMLRCPTRFQHRPSQCDMLHFDLTAGGYNLLRDAGSYSYNCDEPWRSYFTSSCAHNTIRVDDRDPMPKIGRFLYGHWPCGTMDRWEQSLAVSYRDYLGVCYHRTVHPTEEGFRIEDRVEGRFTDAVLRWRLAPELNWVLTAEGCRSSRMTLRVTTTPESCVNRMRLVSGAESLYYLDRSTLPVLEVRLDPSCNASVTEIGLLR